MRCFIATVAIVGTSAQDLFLASKKVPQLWVPHGDVKNTALQATSALTMDFSLGGIEVTPTEQGVSLQVPQWAKLGVAGEPSLPVMRRAMVLPRGAEGQARVRLSNVQTQTFPLSQWGSRIEHSLGHTCLFCNETVNVEPSHHAYSSVYPASGTGVNLVPHTWRDVQGVVVEVNPVAVDHAEGTVQVMHSATIELVVDATAEEPKVVDRDFFGAYAFVYANWEHQREFVADDKAGRVLVIYESQFAQQAQRYAASVKKRLGQDAIMYEADRSADTIKSTIKSHYSEAESLTYITIIGRGVPTPKGSNTRKECDNCYAMMSGGLSLDLFIGRLSGGDASDIETQLSKIENYDEEGTAAWNTHAYGSAFNLAGDEYTTMTNIMNNLGSIGFSQHEWVHGSSASGQQLFSQMNKGLGVFSYLGHGQGDAWDTPFMGQSGIRGLTNTDMPYFEIDVSCDNGAFQTYSPCMGEALLTAKGGAISTMMHAPEARGTMCKHYMVQASKALGSGQTSRVGPVYFAALQAAQAQDPDAYAVQAYNVFGDPTLQLAFAKRSV